MRVLHNPLQRNTAVIIFALLTVFLAPAHANAQNTPQNLKEARASYTDSQTVLAQTQDKLTLAQQTASAAQQTHTLNSTILQDSQTAASNAYSIAVSRQEGVNTLARNMYMAGGAASPTDLFLTTDPATFPLAMDTHNYLTAIANNQILASQAAQTEATRTQEAFQQATIAYQASEKALTEAQGTAKELQTQVEQARTNVNTNAQAYLGYAITYTPPPQTLQDPTMCNNWLVTLLYNAGFRDENIREAWAIAMRESGGNEKSVSNSGDYGVFQFNRATYGHGKTTWWDDNLILTREYNIHMAFVISRGGDTWYPWGLDGQGRVNAQAYKNSGWSDARILDDIVIPYQSWYEKYPCINVDSVSVTPSPSLSPSSALPITTPVSSS